jgi:hypothetical protein
LQVSIDSGFNFLCKSVPCAQEQAERFSTPYTFRTDRPVIISPAQNPVTTVPKGGYLLVQYVGTVNGATLNTPSSVTHQVWFRDLCKVPHASPH